MKRSTLARLRALGFDRSTHEPFTKYHHVRCSMCAALVINGTPTHEPGCGNAPRHDDDDNEEG